MATEKEPKVELVAAEGDSQAESRAAKPNDGYISGLDSLMIGTTALGDIHEDGLSFGGEKPGKIKLYAAQKKKGPSKVLNGKPGSTLISFRLLQLDGTNCKAVLGGTLAATGAYTPPDKFAGIEAKFDIKCDSGHTIRLYKGSLSGQLGGKINSGETLTIDCEIELLEDATGKTWEIFPPGVDPDTPAG